MRGSDGGGYEGQAEIGVETLRRALRGAHEFVQRHPDKILWNGEFGTIRHAPDPLARAAPRLPRRMRWANMV